MATDRDLHAEQPTPEPHPRLLPARTLSGLDDAALAAFWTAPENNHRLRYALYLYETGRIGRGDTAPDPARGTA